MSYLYEDNCESWCCLYHCLQTDGCEMFEVENGGSCYLKTGFDDRPSVSRSSNRDLFMTRSVDNSPLPSLTVYASQNMDSSHGVALSTFPGCDTICCSQKCIMNNECDGFAIDVNGNCYLRGGFSTSGLSPQIDFIYFVLNVRVITHLYYASNEDVSSGIFLWKVVVHTESTFLLLTLRKVMIMFCSAQQTHLCRRGRNVMASFALVLSLQPVMALTLGSIAIMSLT